MHSFFFFFSLLSAINKESQIVKIDRFLPKLYRSFRCRRPANGSSRTGARRQQVPVLEGSVLSWESPPSASHFFPHSKTGETWHGIVYFETPDKQSLHLHVLTWSKIEGRIRKKKKSVVFFPPAEFACVCFSVCYHRNDDAKVHC